MLPMKSRQPNAEHMRLRNLVQAVIRNEMADMPAEEILAVFSQIVGQLVAVQDQRKFTPEMAMEIVAANLEAGNRDAIRALLNTAPSRGSH